MQPTKAAVWVKTTSPQAYETATASLKQQIIDSGCKLAHQECVYGDFNNSLAGLQALVEQAQSHQFQVVFVAHNIAPQDQELYRTLINKLYSLGVSIILVRE